MMDRSRDLLNRVDGFVTDENMTVGLALIAQLFYMELTFNMLLSSNNNGDLLLEWPKKKLACDIRNGSIYVSFSLNRFDDIHQHFGKKIDQACDVISDRLINK